MIDAWLAEISTAVVPGCRPSAALLDGSALERRERREARRAMSAVVRVLPSLCSVLAVVESEVA
ncbi:MAG: hypothetical protein M3548_09720 [Actinomycetota bacterium]|nr:hypothetical protein [Actinomycetota bacterium]